MTVSGLRLEKQPSPSIDWRLYADVWDDQGNLVGSFSEDGISLNEWWATQDEAFQQRYVEQFAIVMAERIADGMAQ